ncbi:unnamed protein product [Caenorhabditis angaria]|uniref:Alpha N-terminal protein methyltransferase 1 n=1 Tax=Caenorhabditis angaria TaxID=860376 RepID=A0A9P1J2F2_9PELO|nr:unnamed protein product [Caenorhabditis angaria]
MNSNISNPHTVYENAENYWSRCSQDVDGMLGGFAKLHQPDILLSKTFLNNLKKKGIAENFDYALDCGAGIGRVTKHLLMPFFKTVDMVDVIEELIVRSSEYIGTDDGIGEKFVEGLQTFEPPLGKYDMIWIQWVSGHLTDDDLKEFFQRCIKGIKPQGTICLKDNVVNTANPLFDSEDNSWTRPEDLVLEIADAAGLRLVAKNLQTGFPKEMYPVKMFAFKPKNPVTEDD